MRRQLLFVLCLLPLACSSEPPADPSPTSSPTSTSSNVGGTGGGVTNSGGGGANSGGSAGQSPVDPGGNGGGGCQRVAIDGAGNVYTGGNATGNDLNGPLTNTMGGNGGGGSLPDPPFDSSAIAGQLEWQIDFDTAAEQQGSSDCTLKVSYQGLADKTVQYLCPECEHIYQVSYNVDPSTQSCATEVGLDDEGHVGYGNGKLYAHTNRLHRLHAVADTAVDGTGTQWTASGTGASYKYGITAEKQRRFTSTVTGTLSITDSDHDPLFGMVPPTDYDCGYSKSGLPEYQGSWEMTDNDIPDGVFLDSCGDYVRLHDMLGSGYAVIEASAIFCGPCNSWAEQEPGFKDEMAQLGIDIKFVTLLVEKTTGPFDVVSQAQLQAWVDEHQLDGPILADRGYGHNVVGPYVQFVKNGVDPADYKYTGYPTWVLVNPSLQVLGVGVGCCPWNTIKAKVKADAGI